jgi:hypothetical protein
MKRKHLLKKIIFSVTALCALALFFALGLAAPCGFAPRYCMDWQFVGEKLQGKFQHPPRQITLYAKSFGPTYSPTTKAPAFLDLQNALSRAQSTHLVRRYHRRYALMDLDALREDHAPIMPQEITAQTLASSLNAMAPASGGLALKAPDFDWMRRDHMRPIDAMRMTFRGNGIPRQIEKLANNQLLEPKLRSFYQAITKKNTTLWEGDNRYSFTLKSFKGDFYHATATPFIAVETISKKDFGRMKSAALPYLWQAYGDDSSPSPASNAGRKITPSSIRQTVDDSTQPRGLAWLNETLAPGSVLQRRKEQVAMAPSQDTTISTLKADAEQLQALFYAGMLNQARSEEESRHLREAILQLRRNPALLHEDISQRFIHQLTDYDPEFSALFLVNNLFEQYNIFSVFEGGVKLRINAIDNRLNMVYTSYNFTFTPQQISEHMRQQFRRESKKEQYHYCEEDMQISDEFFLLTGEEQAFMIRVHLPQCGNQPPHDYASVDNFLSQLRLFNQHSPYLQPLGG